MTVPLPKKTHLQNLMNNYLFKFTNKLLIMKNQNNNSDKAGPSAILLFLNLYRGGLLLLTNFILIKTISIQILASTILRR